MLSIDPGQVDAGRFERLVAAGQAALSQGEGAAAGNRLREALAYAPALQCQRSY